MNQLSMHFLQELEDNINDSGPEKALNYLYMAMWVCQLMQAGKRGG
jgi:hypothetical protein